MPTVAERVGPSISRREPRGWRLERSQIVPRPLEEVFAFFSDAANLESLTPAFLRFRIVTPMPIVMAAGARIDYRLSLFGVPFGWQTRIASFEPGMRFVDVQVSGPYREWHHLHEFHRDSRGTRMIDRVDYDLPFGALGMAVHPAFVRPTLERIFDYRAERLVERFGAAEAA